MIIQGAREKKKVYNPRCFRDSSLSHITEIKSVSKGDTPGVPRNMEHTSSISIKHCTCVSNTSRVEERRGKCNGGKGREMTAQSIVQRPVRRSCSQYKQIEDIAMEQAHMDVRGRLEWTKVKEVGCEC
jgi:hypothetical protein